MKKSFVLLALLGFILTACSSAAATRFVHD